MKSFTEGLMASMCQSQDPRDSSVPSLTFVPGAPWDFISESLCNLCSSVMGAGDSQRLLGWGEGVWVSVAQDPHLENWVWGQLGGPSQRPHFPPQIRQAAQGGQPRSSSGLVPAKHSVHPVPCPPSRAAQVTPGLPWGPGTQ